MENPVEFYQEQQVALPACIVAIAAIVGILALIFSRKK
jgi:hypothetical protein